MIAIALLFIIGGLTAFWFMAACHLIGQMEREWETNLYMKQIQRGVDENV